MAAFSAELRQGSPPVLHCGVSMPVPGGRGLGNKMRLAILGIRGIPAAYGGFETFAEELGPRLASAGHEVTVYGRRHAVEFLQYR